MSMSSAQSFSDRVRMCRELVPRMSTRELDRLAGLVEGHTSAIETGRRGNVELKTAAKIAAVFDVSLDWLANGEGVPPTEDSVRAAIERARTAQEVPDESGPHAIPDLEGATGTDGKG